MEMKVEHSMVFLQELNVPSSTTHFVEMKTKKRMDASVWVSSVK